MRRLVLAVAAVLLFDAGVSAQNLDVIKQRQKIYKSFGEATKPIAAMIKGQADFDLAVVKKALTTYSEGSKQLPALFPEDSKTGGDTEALPAIWDHKADFESRLKTFGADSDAALTTITDKASFSATFPTISKQCGGCHKEYREKKEKN